MIKFKGQVKFKQYIKNKPVKNGIKLYLCCNPHNGYAYSGIVYTGKDTVEKNQTLTLTDSIIVSLVKDYLNSFRILYMDNFFTSTRLSNYLLKKKTGMIGTLRKNRLHALNHLDFPSQKNNIFYFYDLKSKNKILALYNDTSKVAFLSNVDIPEDWQQKSSQNKQETYISNKLGIKSKGVLVHEEELEEAIKGFKPNKNERPSIARNYVKFAKGVDLCNQKTTHYRFPHKSRKWWKPVFFHFLQVTIHNANIVYNSCEQIKLNFKQFYNSIVKEFLGDKLKEKDDNIHTSSYIPLNNKIRGSKNCILCKKASKIKCQVCSNRNDNIYFCGRVCFNDYHYFR